MTKNFGVKASKIQGNKRTICSLSLILILAVSMIMAFAQPTLAQIGVPQPEKTTGYIDVAPRLLGVGQEATVNLFVYPIPTNYAYQPYYDGYRGVTVTFVKPDGTKDTFMPVDGTHVYDAGQTQSLGAIYFFYKPNMAGNWSVSFTMPDQKLTDVSGTVLMTGCTSKPAYFTVQTDPVLAGLLNGYPWSPLPNPNVFWNYPINSNNREWSQISGDWLGSSVNGAGQKLWQPYGSGPNTGHIVWKQQYRDGGIIGGDYGSLSYGTQGSSIGSIVMEGKLYVNIPLNVPGAGAFGIGTAQFECIDLATGEVLYIANGSISAGIHSPQNAYTQAGFSPTGNVVLESSYGNSPNPFLWGTSGTTWNYYAPLTGTLVRSIVNASSARPIDGTELAFGVSGVAPNQSLFRWNMTKVVNNNWPTGIEWQKPLPKSAVDALNVTTARASALQKSLLAISSDASTLVVKATTEYRGYSAETGASLWNLTLNYPTTANQQIGLYPTNAFIILDPTESTFKCYSMLTGALLWTSTSFSDATWATTWTVYSSETSDNDNFYAQFPDCTVRAYSLQDGHEIWRSKPIASTEYPNNVVPYVQNMLMVGGKIYAYAGYASSYKINPISRHSMIVCIDATTGDTLFTLNGGIRVSSAANGYVIGSGDFDGNLWCVGKGKTETTVTAPLTSVPAGTGVLIQGFVMDMSPASPNTPAVSDADMSEWMDYLHMQNATLLNNPPVPKGVTVKLVALGPNHGDVIDIGTVTSDSGGLFSYMWTPPSEGKYTVYATFDGSNSYYGSYAETALGVTKATESPTQPVVEAPDYTMTIIGGVIAVIIAVVIAVAVAVLLLRKR